MPSKKKMKKITVILALVFALNITTPAVLRAEEICTQVYGQPVVCGASSDDFKHTPVDTGLADIDLKTLGLAMILASAAIYTYKRFDFGG